MSFLLEAKEDLAPDKVAAMSEDEIAAVCNRIFATVRDKFMNKEDLKIKDLRLGGDFDLRPPSVWYPIKVRFSDQPRMPARHKEFQDFAYTVSASPSEPYPFVMEPLPHDLNEVRIFGDDIPVVFPAQASTYKARCTAASVGECMPWLQL